MIKKSKKACHKIMQKTSAYLIEQLQVLTNLEEKKKEGKID